MSSPVEKLEYESEKTRFDKDHETKPNVPGLTEDIYAEGSLDAEYQHKARVLNDAIQEIGMGKYQVCGRVFLSATPNADNHTA